MTFEEFLKLARSNIPVLPGGGYSVSIDALRNLHAYLLATGADPVAVLSGTELECPRETELLAECASHEEALMETREELAAIEEERSEPRTDLTQAKARIVELESARCACAEGLAVAIFQRVACVAALRDIAARWHDRAVALNAWGETNGDSYRADELNERLRELNTAILALESKGPTVAAPPDLTRLRELAEKWRADQQAHTEQSTRSTDSTIWGVTGGAIGQCASELTAALDALEANRG